MDEPTAWLNQASADRDAAERFVADEGGIGRCHAIAKWQQAVEKNVKALVSVLHHAGHMKAGIVQKHDVSRYMSGLLRRLRCAQGDSTIQSHLHRLFDEKTRADIECFTAWPRMQLQRNTEYPFQDAAGQWTYPAARGVFSSDEVKKFRGLASRIQKEAERIVDAVRRGPK